jgi:hypothetical protein
VRHYTSDSVPPSRSGYNHIDIMAAALGADQPLSPIRDRSSCPYLCVARRAPARPDARNSDTKRSSERLPPRHRPASSADQAKISSAAQQSGRRLSSVVACGGPYLFRRRGSPTTLGPSRCPRSRSQRARWSAAERAADQFGSPAKALFLGGFHLLVREFCFNVFQHPRQSDGEREEGAV